MPPERTPRRQEPASCESCRRKKLRCDRNLPCHNCESRSLSCAYQGRRPVEPEQHIGSTATVSELQAENAVIRARLQRLEDAVLRGNSAHESATLTGASTATASLRSPVTPADGAPDGEHARAYSEDSRRLEDVSSISLVPLPHLTISLVPEIVSLSMIVDRIVTNAVPPYIMIPPREDTRYLFEAYVQHLDALQHIIHIPSVRSRLDALFHEFENPGAGTVSYTHLALPLAILANIAGFWAFGNTEGTLFASRSDASAVATYWLQCSLDVLEHVWRAGDTDLTVIQTRILLMFLVYHTEGISPKARHIMATAVADAKDMGLHMTDHPHSKVREDTRADIIETEMRRRVWWHLAATDWSTALFGGPHNGVYTIQLHHMHVKRPRNITDEDLLTRPADFERPCDEPTSTTYYLSRIVLGLICREVADTLLEIQASEDPQQVPYSRILELDQKFKDLLATLPSSLRLSSAERQNVLTSYSDAKVPHAKQRYFTYLTTEARRCKLHLPYLLRVQKDPQYQYSRDTCLESARNILRLKHILPSEASQPTRAIKMIGLLHHFCCAIIILVMDVCVNKDMGDEEERKAEIRAACKIVEDAKESSMCAGTFLDSLMAILHKHEVQLHPNGDALHPNEMCHNAPGRFGTGLFPPEFMAGADGTTGKAAEVSFDDWWQSYLDFGPDIKPVSWDAVFSDIEMVVP